MFVQNEGGSFDRHRFRSKRPFLALAAVVLLLAGCAEDDNLGASSPVFDGLPADIVEESLGDPSVEAALTLFTDEEKPGVLQLNISSRIFCRDLLVEYEEWVTAGQIPDVPRVVTPTHPEPGFDKFMTSWVEMTQVSINSGDPDQLRSQLLAGGGCPDVVADPATDGKQTIADRLAG